MTTGVLLVTHTGIGSAMIKTASQIWHIPAPKIGLVEIAFDADPRETTAAIRNGINSQERGSGVLILTDLIGATPSNQAAELTDQSHVIVSGLNLPMLIRVYNYRNRPLPELAQIAQEGAQRGICQLTNDKCVNLKET